MYFKDSNSRSLVKAISWRLIGTMDTILLSFLITGDSSIAFYIGTAELVTKTILYYLHERIWNRVAWGRGKFFPSHLRSFAKSISWRAVGTIDTIFLSYYISGDLSSGLSIGMSELITKIGLFYLHERIWSLIKWGRRVINQIH